MKKILFLLTIIIILSSCKKEETTDEGLKYSYVCTITRTISATPTYCGFPLSSMTKFEK
jgi:hypothetical protein